eukprot:15049852-Ditylum_brightwellii.AAC.1
MKTRLQQLADSARRNTSVQIQTAARNYLRRRRRRTARARIITMRLILKPFNAVLDLNKAEDCKLFEPAMHA